MSAISVVQCLFSCRRQGCTTMLLLLSAFALRAIEENPEAPPSKVLVRERTVYVPYEKLKETFEKEGRGVFLPYEEFLKLWNAGQPKEKPPEEVKPPADAVIAGGSYVGIAGENAVRFEVTYKIRALGKNWSEIALPLRNVAMESATVSDPLAVFAPKGDGYALELPKPGEYTLTLAFSVRVESKPGQRRIEFGIPPTAVSRLDLTIPEKDLRVDVSPKMAATVATPEGNNTKVLAFVGNAAQVAVTWMPPSGKTEKGKAIVIASQGCAVKLGERILHIDTAINYRIESNEEDTFKIKMPADMRLLSVKGNKDIRDWVENAGELTVHLHVPTKEAFSLVLRFERILEKTPENLAITFPQVVDALREDGYITVSHDAGLRLRVESSTGLSQIDARELPDTLKGGNILAGFRYVAHPLALALKIDTILPQIQSSVKAIASIGIEEDTLVGWVDFTISKVGIFTAKLKFPNRWDVASVGDPQTIEDFQVAVDGADKVLTVNLKNKAIGDFRLKFKLTSLGRATPGDVTLETVQVIGTQQDQGLLGVSAPKAFKLTTVPVAGGKMVSANWTQLVKFGLFAELSAEFDQPLAYTYTAQPAVVKVTVERRLTEIRVDGKHTILVTEGGLEMHHNLGYFINYAGTDRLAFSMPSTLDDKLVDVKCAGMKEKRKVSTANGRTKWEVVLQEKTLDRVVVDIIYNENLIDLKPEKPQDILIPDVRAEDVSDQKGFISVKKESALEIKPDAVNLDSIEPANLPVEMRTGNVYLAYHYTQGERSLTLKLTRHIPVQVSGTIVDLMRATFVVSDERKLTANLDLFVENARGEQYLALLLPKDAVVRAAVVNRSGVSPLKREEDGATLFKLASGPSHVQIVYSAPLESSGKMGLLGGLEVSTPEVRYGAPAQLPPPVNKIEADVYVPDDYAYFNFSGTLHRRECGDVMSNTFEWIGQALAIPGPPPVANGEVKGIPPAPDLSESIALIGKQYRFQTLASRGTVSMTFADRKLFTLFDVLFFLAVFTGGVLLIWKKRLSALWVCAGIIFVPMCWSWLSTSDFGELPRSGFAAGVVLAGVVLLVQIGRAFRNWREERIARAPDPYLEDAVAPAKAADVTPPAASASAPAAAAEPPKRGAPNIQPPSPGPDPATGAQGPTDSESKTGGTK